MDRSWINQSRMSPEYEDGVEQFLQFSSERSRPDENEIFFLFVHKMFERETAKSQRHTRAFVV